MLGKRLGFQGVPVAFHEPLELLLGKSPLVKKKQFSAAAKYCISDKQSKRGLRQLESWWTWCRRVLGFCVLWGWLFLLWECFLWRYLSKKITVLGMMPLPVNLAKAHFSSNVWAVSLSKGQLYTLPFIISFFASDLWLEMSFMVGGKPLHENHRL